ncbi:hypothetical protein GALMADRAFT_149278 [Galerina marginata CBS 339.88]|uniref:RNase H type-1 domain-containing protein n=1 Tax=Galerina marginata (strain CBS 339.88) TaxID=685588 RepID=A0A067S4L4_GALM3|nr:hypothetical protein GALMADRAFT_149278 [Galerina marginata CBS 339.88]
MRYQNARGQAYALIDWLFKSVDIIDLDTNQPVQDPRTSLWIPYISQQASALLVYKNKAEQDKLKGAKGCTLATLKRQILLCFQESYLEERVNAAIEAECEDFFFDRKLTFHEHVRFYSTKAFSSVQAMRMLGSSTKGLEPHSKRLLYRSCVVPIATYGYHLWYFDRARCKGSVKLLSQMQRKAALWITGAFSTSPGPGVEALAGLLPIHLLLERMATHGILRAGTFSETHPVRSFLTGHMLGKATPHPLSVQLMTRRQRLGTKGPIMDIYWSRVHFDDSLAPLEKEDRSLYLDFISDMFMSDTWGLCIGVDASVFTNPASKKATQAVAAGVLYSQGVEVNRFRWLVGRATAPDAEMSAICRAIGLTTKRICEHIAIFTDSIAMAKRALDPSLHSSQSHSLLACKALEAWLADDPLRWISFHHVPSKLKWGMQYEAHLLVTLDRLRMEADATAARRWAKASTDRPQDMGRDFLQLRKLGKKVITITPDIRKGGPWIRKAGGDNTSFARLCRCILNHAPIGSYYRWFNIQEPHGCPRCGAPRETRCGAPRETRCGAPRETRSHILSYCPGYERPAPTDRLHGLVEFLLE